MLLDITVIGITPGQPQTPPAPHTATINTDHVMIIEPIVVGAGEQPMYSMELTNGRRIGIDQASYDHYKTSLTPPLWDQFQNWLTKHNPLNKTQTPDTK